MNFNEIAVQKALIRIIQTRFNSKNKFQSTEFISDCGHGIGFAIGNILKYAQRYGKKGGFNRNDLTKVAHYVIIMLYLHDNFYTRESQGDQDEIK